MSATTDLKAAAFDLGSEPALVIGPDGALAAANDAAQARFGHALAALARGRFSSALPRDGALAVLIARAGTKNGPVREDDVAVTLPGLPDFQADVAAAPLGDGSVLLTLRPRASLGMGAADLRSMVELGRTLAHEIRNPLAGIRGAAQLLKSGATPQDEPLAQLIVDETDRIRRLVDRMTIFADEAAPQCAAVNLHQVLDRVRALAPNGAAAGVTITRSYDPSLPDAWADEDQLVQVFLNLVKNAAEAAMSRADGAGIITISTAYRHGARVRGQDGGHGAPLEVRIQDNGPGVPEAMRQHLFAPFVSSKAQGMGLGLALAAKLVGGHGGLIDFESEPGRTVFRVLLPMAPKAEKPARTLELSL